MLNKGKTLKSIFIIAKTQLPVKENGLLIARTKKYLQDLGYFITIMEK